MSPAGARLPALLLALLVCGAHGLLALRDGRRVPASLAPLELLAPGLCADDGRSLPPPFDAPAPPPGYSLPRAVLLAEDSAATLLAPYAGLGVLCLALLGVLSARPPRRAGATLVRAGMLVAALVTGVALQISLLVVGGLAVAGALGLAGIADTPQRSEGRGAQLVTAAVAVLLAVALIGLSLRAGFATDAEALRPLLDRLAPAERAAWDPSGLARNAAHLRAVLDRSALAAFAGMAALLLHLKSRARWSAALVLVVTAADLASAAR